MKIGFDVSQTGRHKAGCGYFADSLIRSLADIDRQNEYLLYPTFGDVFWDPDCLESTCQIPQANFRRGLGHRTFEMSQEFWRNPPNDFEQQLGSPDIIHANNFYCPTSLKKARLVYTLYDLAFVDHPEWSTEANRLGCFSGTFNASLYADLIIAISEYSRNHFLRTFPHYPPERVVVVYPASRFAYRDDLEKPQALPELQSSQFWLSVGTLEPRKNHRRLLEAYARLKETLDQRAPLVLVGGQGWLVDDFARGIGELGLQDDVLMLGYVDDSSLQWLYQNCIAFIYPSLFEGFGLPVLEAMSLGASVITSTTSSLPEIVGGAGLLVNPEDSGEIAMAMKMLAQDNQQRLHFRHDALERSKLFSWEDTARRVLQLYARLQTASTFLA